MNLSKVELHNFRGINQLEVNLHPKMTVFVGVNGAGKTSLLDAIAYLLSWVTSRIRHEGSSGRAIRDNDIKNKTAFAEIKAIDNNGNEWKLVKTQKGYLKHGVSTDLKFVNEYVKKIQGQLQDCQMNCSIPLFVYYPINRAVMDIPLRIKMKHSFELLEAYDESLTSAANFRSFFEWFRNREDLENELISRSTKRSIFNDEPENQFPDKQLSAVRDAIACFLPGYSNLRVKRSPLRMTISKQGKDVLIDQLSDGEKCLVGVVGDLARRLAIANPTLENPLAGEGVVLIDEIELHLHPQWQRFFITSLQNVFPNCQFILTTHSPQSIGELLPENIRLLIHDNDELLCITPTQSLGLDSSQILEELMNTPSRNLKIKGDLNEIYNLMDKEEFTEAIAAIMDLKKKLHGDIPEIVKAEALIAMLK
ncbi:MAG TPA: AAA family ATPase [Williamwhitmania sp.]|nr:AAA family ATPase [Williamwhitmania sp.]